MRDHREGGRSALGGAACGLAPRRGQMMKSPNQKNLRLLPAVDRVLNLADVVRLCAQYGRSTVTDWVREILSEMRNGRADDLPPDSAQIEAEVIQSLHELAGRAAAQRLRKVING